MSEELIPENIQNLALDLADLAIKYNLRTISGKIEHREWSSNISSIDFSWQGGRYGANANQVHLSCTRYIHLSIEDRAIQAGKDVP